MTQPKTERERQIQLSDLYIAAQAVLRLYDQHLLVISKAGDVVAFRELRAAIKACER